MELMKVSYLSWMYYLCVVGGIAWPMASGDAWRSGLLVKRIVMIHRSELSLLLTSQLCCWRCETRCSDVISRLAHGMAHVQYSSDLFWSFR